MKIEAITKFSDTVISVRTLCPFEKETITAYNLMAYMIKSKTEKYDSKESISKELNKRYGMKVSAGLTTYGNQISYQLRFQFIRHDWIKNTEYSKQVLEAMDQFLFHPDFTEETLAEAKYLLRNRLISLLDDPGYLSMTTALKNANEKHKVSIQVYGYLEELDKVTLKDIEDVYSIYQSKDKHIYVCGVLDDSIQNYLESIDSKNPIKKDYALLTSEEVKTKTIQKDIEQTYVSLIYSTNSEVDGKEYYNAMVMNSILGQAPMNLLFENVREKHSLCYSISSNMIRFDGVLCIHLGTKKHQVKQALSLIEEQINKLIQMDYPDINLDIAKKDLTDAMIGNLDHSTFYIESAFLDEMLMRTGTLEDRILMVSDVTKEDVSTAAKRLKLASVCIVEECNDAL